MATIIANIDNFDPRWENGELEKVIFGYSENDAIGWLRDNCACAEGPADPDEIFDDTIIETPEYKVVYGDFGYIEVVRLIKL